MSTLETLVAGAAHNGRLRGLTVWPTPSGQYQANATTDGQGWRVEIDADPVVALRRVLGEPKQAPKASIFE